MAKIETTYTQKQLGQVTEVLDREGIVQLKDYLTQTPRIIASWNRSATVLTHSFEQAEPTPEILTLFAPVIRAVSSKSQAKGSLLRFGTCDYTLLHDALKAHTGIVMLYDFNTLKEEWGGYSSFVTEQEEAHRVVPEENTLTLLRARGLRSFIKRVNHHALRSRVVLILTL